MANKQLKEYVEQTRAAGYSDVQIKHALEKAGWSKKEIDETMGVNISSDKTHHIASNHHSSPIDSISTKKKQKNLEKKPILIFGASFVLVIIALIVIWLINLSNQATVSQELCQGSKGMECVNAAIITKDTISFVLLNNAGSKIVIDNIQSTNKKCIGTPKIVLTSANETSAINSEVKANEAFLIKINGCENGATGQAYNNNIELKYINTDNANALTANIIINGKVQ
jgi:hypothetical protein